MSPGAYDALWGGAWDRAARSGPGFRSRYAILIATLARHGVSGRVLEVGAGPGHFLTRLHERFPYLELSAHETSDAALDALGDLPFLQAVYAGEVPGELDHAGFHAIVCSEVLEHVADHGGLLDRMVAVLRPAGRLVLTVPLRWSLWTKVDQAVGHQRRYRRGQLARMCRERGLVIDEDRGFGFPLYNTYYRLMGSRTPDQSAEQLASPLAAVASQVLTALFIAESRLDSPLGGRGLVVAHKPSDPKARNR